MNSGIGYFTALELARRGAHVLLASRDRTRGEAALPGCRRRHPALRPRSYSSIWPRSLRFASLPPTCSIRIAPSICSSTNAGIYAPPQRLETAEGFELQFGTNVLSHFTLTALLWPSIEKVAATGRIVMLASIAHKRAGLDFDDLQAARRYSPTGSYSQSKLADLMLSFELDRGLRAAGSPILSVAAHPGLANTNLFHAGDLSAFERLARKAAASLIDLLLNPETSGALPTLFAATAPDAKSGGYYSPQGFQEMRGGDVGPAQIAPQALDQAAAKKLWETCESLTGITFL